MAKKSEARKSGKGSKRRATSGAKRRAIETTEEVVTKVTSTRVKPEPVAELVTEKRVIETTPEVEIRRPATLAQALTQGPVAVVKPRTRVRTVERTRRAA